MAPLPWRETAFLASGLVIGVPLLVVCVVALALSGLTVFLPGAALVVLSALVRLVDGEPARFSTLIGQPLVVRRPEFSGPDARSRWRAALADQELRGWVGYALLRLPLSLIQATVVVVVTVWPLIMILSLVRGLTTGAFPVAGPFAPGSVGWPWLAVTMLVGMVAVITVVAPVTVRALAAVDVRLTQRLLSGSRDLSRQRVAELVEARSRVVTAADAERVRIERDLHDGAQQRLIALGVSLGRAEARLLRSDRDSDALELVRSAKAETMGVVADIRALTRGLRPPILDSRGLDAALSSVASGLGVRASISIEVDRLGAAVEAVLYFALSECLTNAAKHAPAAHVEVVVRAVDAVVRAEVRDDGPGGAELVVGGGLSGIADRLAGLDGRLWLTSPPGGPTVVRLEVPCVS